MNFEYSKNPKIVKRINELKRFRIIYLITLALIIINIYLWNYVGFNKGASTFQIIIYIVLMLLLILVISYMRDYFVLSKSKESILMELDPELFLNINIWISKLKLFNDKTKYNSALINIASAYIYDGKYDEAKDVLDYLEKQKLSKKIRALYLLRKAEWLFFKKKYKEIKDVKDDILYEIDSLPQDQKLAILSNLDMYIAMVDKDKKKLKLICESLEKNNTNIQKVYSLYIKSLFFEEKDNKYQKMLAFEGGNLFIAREEYEDQNITTKNNIKPNKHKVYKNTSIIILVSQIIFLILGIILIIL